MVSGLRIVFFGTPEFAVPSLRALILSQRHTVVAVVTQPDRPRGRHQRVHNMPVKSTALAWAPVLQPDCIRTPDFVAQLRGFNPDLGVVAAYGKILPETVLAVPRLGMINVHASLLPSYRGAAPIQRAVMAGETETGVTIMRVIRELDAGAMFAKAVRPIGPDETSDTIAQDLAELGGRLLLQVVDRIAAGTTTEEPQDDSQATYAPRLTKEEGAIDWSTSARTIHNKVRGLYPWPHAHTFIAGERTIVLRTCVGPSAAPVPEPGTILDVSRDAIHVATGDGAIVLEQLRPEGRRSMTTREFLASRRLSNGMVLGVR